MTDTRYYISRFHSAYRWGMERRLSEWPARSTIEALKADAAKQAPAGDEDGWIYWGVRGWIDVDDLLRSGDLETYKWERYGRQE